MLTNFALNINIQLHAGLHLDDNVATRQQLKNNPCQQGLHGGLHSHFKYDSDFVHFNIYG